MARLRNLLPALLLAFCLAPGEGWTHSLVSRAPQAPQVEPASGDIVLVGKRKRGKWKRLNRRSGTPYRIYRLQRGEWNGRPMRVIILRRYKGTQWKPVRPQRVALPRRTEVTEPKTKSMVKPETRNSVVKPETRNIARPATKPETRKPAETKTAAAALATPKTRPPGTKAVKEAKLAPREVAPKRQRPAKQASRIGCDRGASIVGDYGFSDIQPKQCAGREFVFEAKRDGETFSVSLAADDGELTKVTKHKRQDAEVWQ